MKIKTGIATFMLPGQEGRASKLLNDPNVNIITKERHFASKDGFILLYVEFEDFREEGALEEDAGEDTGA